ncbi:hypothetical protein FA13DRAFT_1815705 [Coprinellus micaceus]|uniref:Uncharacterized protein n=1 Tax=Coprinellus micaceus TaxID=71717 RepID=A0A4Y7T3H9_COPMI|nr:hypothetical protein FA13DRAFT_1815705 [Coprinellus micaceus]
MPFSVEQIQALTDTVAMWRMHEYTIVPSYCFYVFYVLETMPEEVSLILPQRWGRGKGLYMIMRYGTLVYIALGLSRDYRNYFSISPGSCKALLVLCQGVLFCRVIVGDEWAFTRSGKVANGFVVLTCDFSLGLCISALLQAKLQFVIAILAISCGLSTVTVVLAVVSLSRRRAEPVSPLFVELGYPCYNIAGEEWSKQTVAGVGRSIRAYVNFAATTLLGLLCIGAITVRYKGQSGRLVRVLLRDGGIHALSLLAIRMTWAVLWTPEIVPPSELDGSPAYFLANVASNVIIPILAQRLLLNMRKVDYAGSEPIASKLLFSPPVPGIGDELDLDRSGVVLGLSDRCS